MLHSVHDLNVNPGRINRLMDNLRRLEENPEVLEYQRGHRNDEDLPPPYSSGSTTQMPTPELVPASDQDARRRHDELVRKPLSASEIGTLRDLELYDIYDPFERYQTEANYESNRIFRASTMRNGLGQHTYRGLNTAGTNGGFKACIMERHCIKKRWEQLGVWNPVWGFPDRYETNLRDTGPWRWPWDEKLPARAFDKLPQSERHATWPPLDQERPFERAFRCLLEDADGDDAVPTPLPSTSGEDPTLFNNYRERSITSRPWYHWQVETTVQRMKLMRSMYLRSDRYEEAIKLVRARWKKEGIWKESWDRNDSFRVTRNQMPGWRWRHESPSPEPPDVNDLDFTPSERDALEEIPPPTPPAPSPLTVPQYDAASTDHEGFSLFKFPRRGEEEAPVEEADGDAQASPNASADAIADELPRKTKAANKTRKSEPAQQAARRPRGRPRANGYPEHQQTDFSRQRKAKRRHADEGPDPEPARKSVRVIAPSEAVIEENHTETASARAPRRSARIAEQPRHEAEQNASEQRKPTRRSTNTATSIAKPRRGRPPGSKTSKKLTTAKAPPQADSAKASTAKRPRGRPPKQAGRSTKNTTSNMSNPTKVAKRRGRPPGSKAKATKQTDAQATSRSRGSGMRSVQQTGSARKRGRPRQQVG